MSRDHAEPHFRETWTLYDYCCHSQWRISQTGSDTVHLHKPAIPLTSHYQQFICMLFLYFRMEELGLHRDGNSVCFGQLLGMCDHVSLTLGKKSHFIQKHWMNSFPCLSGTLINPQIHLLLSAQHGFSVYKSVPYGSVDDTLPYLVRRAQENRTVLQGIRKERDLLRQELRHRLKEKISGAR